ncbi:hypothetical protein HAX54_028150, partial [Datura stramonium]|nr:hypothetical protein [Datura stramonium]
MQQDYLDDRSPNITDLENNHRIHNSSVLTTIVGPFQQMAGTRKRVLDGISGGLPHYSKIELQELKEFPKCIEVFPSQ